MDTSREDAFILFAKWFDESTLVGLDVGSAGGLKLRFVGLLRDVKEDALLIVSESGFDKVTLPLPADTAFRYFEPREASSLTRESFEIICECALSIRSKTIATIIYELKPGWKDGLRAT